MELVEIIVNVLKIFSLASIGILILAYLFFKVKDRTRIKPYMLIDTEAALLANPDPADYDLPLPINADDPLRYKQFSNRFQVINEERLAVQNYSSHEVFYKPVVREHAAINIMHKAPTLYSSHQYYSGDENSNNIYNLYSPGTEQMHKLKIGR